MKSRYFWLIATFIGTKSSTITYRQIPSLQMFTEYIPFSFAYCSPNSCRILEGSSARIVSAL